ncbi:MAG: hypothetical protein R3F19_12560 [Verrucomicrobiales bacterium]|jgi:hypothetical protein
MKKRNLLLSFKLTAALAITMLGTPAFGEEGAVERPVGPVRGDNPNVGIKYDKKQGLFVTPFSAKLLGLKTADVGEQEITGKITLQAQVFDVFSSEGRALASAWLPQEDAEKLQSDAPITMERGFKGKIVSVASKVNGQGEVLLEIEDKDGKLKVGNFLSGTVEVSSDGEVVVVPKDAVVNSSEGAFAYVNNGGWTARAQVEVGAEQDGLVEIIDGLYAGDVIVTTPVMTLWMTELALLKSGKA